MGVLAIIATSPLIPLALFFKKMIERTFEGITVAGFGFLITAGILLATAWLRRRDGTKGPAETTWLDALLIGLAQMFAPLPGVSRSGLTIAAALALGLSRTWAVGFSLLIAVPAILGAAVWEIRKVDPATLSSDRVAQAVAAHDPGGRGRLFRNPVAVQGRSRGPHLVLLGLPHRAGDRRCCSTASDLTEAPGRPRHGDSVRVGCRCSKRRQLATRIFEPSLLKHVEPADLVNVTECDLDTLLVGKPARTGRTVRADPVRPGSASRKRSGRSKGSSPWRRGNPSP